MTIRKRIATLLLSFLLLFVIGGETFLSAIGITASAETVEYSNVLDDLQKDKNFNAADYPAKADDYSLQVIQIAEGSNGELFVYVYQPNFEYTGNRASYINIAFQDQRDPEAELKYERKSLTFLNSNGVFCKYLLNNFTVKVDTVRYYSVAAIYRSFVEGIDKTYESIDMKQHVKYAVGKLWTVCLYNNVLKYGAFNIDTVDVEITASGDIYYSDGVPGLYLSGCNSHYFAFKVNGFDVTEIYDADVTYNLIPYWERALTLSPTIDDSKDKIIVESKSIYSEEEVVFVADGLFGKDAHWKRIQTVSEFLKDAEKQNKSFTDSELADINKSQFVFRVAESDYRITFDTYGDHIYQYYRLEDSGVLRLHFATTSGVYNIGAVSDLVGTDGNSDTKDSIDPEFFDWFKFAVFILVCIFLWNPISALVRFVYSAFETLLSWILFILTFPIRVVKRFARK